MSTTRSEVIKLYKTFLHLGKNYPTGYGNFRQKVHDAFMKNRDVSDPKQIKRLIRRGQYVVKEVEALYFLKKYRAMKNRYYD